MKFGIIGNLEKPGLAEAVEQLIKRLNTHDAGYVIDEEIVKLLPNAARLHVNEKNSRPAARCATEADMVVAFGGDGTILAAARSVGDKGTPILGINLGKLGFLAELAKEEMEQAIGDILAGKYVIEERLVLAARSPSIPDKVFHAVNDIVVDKSRSSRVIDLEMHINGAFAVTYRGDGLIISTPTGSTAYALSNGGPIVTPTSNVIGITPISPHTLSGRPLIVPETSTIRVIVHGNSDEVLLSSDGQMEEFLTPPVEIQIQKAKYNVRLVKRMDRTYFDVLRAKLLWGKDVRST
jgi:NAD+ kinase